MPVFRSGSNSYGQFWFGGNTFPGFIFKKMLEQEVVEVRNLLLVVQIISNQPNEFWNKYTPGSGVGTSRVST